jgi:hypothetical protein
MKPTWAKKYTKTKVKKMGEKGRVIKKTNIKRWWGGGCNKNWNIKKGKKKRWIKRKKCYLPLSPI